MNLLTAKPSPPEYRTQIDILKHLHLERMNENIDDDVDELPLDIFLKTFKTLGRKPGKKYDFIIKAGNSFKYALYNVMNIVWKTENIPEGWLESTVTQLKKGKTQENILDDFRHIHDRNIFSKYLSHMVMSIAKPILFENLTKFQIACRSGHRPSEHLFVIKSVFAKFQQDGKGILVTSYDLEKFFDFEDIFDILNEVYLSKVTGKIYRLIYEMNKNVRIKVKTPVGITETEDTGPGASQGSVDAAVISSVSLGNGVSKAFEDSTYEIAYGNIEMSAQIFMDDVFRMGENVESAQYANNVMEELVGKKSLKLNFDKSSYVIMGNKKSKRIMSLQLKKTPLMLNNKEMQEEKMIKYLGDFLASNLEESVHNTVVKRASIARHSIYEIRSVVEDTRADRAGALNIAFDLWEQGLLGMILYNSETWVSMKKKTLKVLDDLFHLFCRVVLRTSVSCPKVSFY